MEAKSVVSEAGAVKVTVVLDREVPPARHHVLRRSGDGASFPVKGVGLGIAVPGEMCELLLPAGSDVRVGDALSLEAAV